LFRLDRDHWNLISRLPHSIPANPDNQFSMTALNHVPILAYRASPKAIELLQSDGEGWKNLGTINCPFSIRKISMLNMDDRLIAWAVADEGGVGELFSPNGSTWTGKILQFSATFSVIDSAIAVFNGELRVLAIGPHEQFQEQRYDPAGQPIGKTTAVETPPNANEITLRDLLNWSVLGLLIIITLASAQQGYGLKELKIGEERVVLAPLSLRLAAGLIDFWPLYVMVFIFFGRHHRTLVPSELQDLDRFTIWSVAICLSLYLLHPLIAELVWGRSVGKMFVGLKVIGADGRAARKGAILLRNVLRVVEAPLLLGVPLLVIYFTPMRQRIGDMIAGTLVVARAEPPRGNG
jgi:uncharacterized RDD family membrane protein YckC